MCHSERPHQRPSFVCLGDLDHSKKRPSLLKARLTQPQPYRLAAPLPLLIRLIGTFVPSWRFALGSEDAVSMICRVLQSADGLTTGEFVATIKKMMK